jgi:lipoate-protein ligase A
MRRLLLTLPTPAENLALDEALLDLAEEEMPDAEFLRLWESPQPIVVVGRSSRVGREIRAAACRERAIPVLRRSSGGAAIVAGPGCLMFAVVLSYLVRPELRDISRAHRFVLDRVANSLQTRLTAPQIVARAGTSDLVLRKSSDALLAHKFSGNSLRAKRTHLLYHGTLLYDFDLSLIDTCLAMPPRQPDYRREREHRDFVTNLPLRRAALVESLIEAWPASVELVEWPLGRVAELVTRRFSRDEWNFEFA